VLNLSTIYAHVVNRVCVQQIGTLKPLTFSCLCLTAGWVEQFYVVFGVIDVLADSQILSVVMVHKGILCARLLCYINDKASKPLP